MTNLSNFNETPQRALGIQGCIVNGLVSAKPEGESFEAWIVALTKLAEQHEREARFTRDSGSSSSHHTRLETCETKPPLEKVAEGPWRSLGGYFDYSLWPDRERFMELDRAIAASQELREPVIDHGIGIIQMLDFQE